MRDCRDEVTLTMRLGMRCKAAGGIWRAGDRRCVPGGEYRAWYAWNAAGCVGLSKGELLGLGCGFYVRGAFEGLDIDEMGT